MINPKSFKGISREAEWKLSRIINVNCCTHYDAQSDSGRKEVVRYYIGYVGLRICKVAYCLDCEEVQYIGGRLGALILPICMRWVGGRVNILGVVEFPLFHKVTKEEIDKGVVYARK